MCGSIHVPLQWLCLFMLTASYVQGDYCPASNLPTVGNSTHDGDGTYAVGEVVTYTCNEGFKYVVRPNNTAVNVTCAASGKFIGTVPSCKYIDPNMDYGVGWGCEASGLCCPGQSNGCSTAGYCYCDEMCMTFGDCCSDYYTYCQGVVVIPEVYCSGLPHLDNSYNNGDGVYQEGAVITYTCNTGFAFQNPSQNAVTCSSWGSFSGSLSPCLHICPPSTLPYIAYSTHNGDGYYLEGETVYYSCNSGYTFQYSGQSATTCTFGGYFAGTISACLKTCWSFALPSVAHATHNGDGPFMDGDVVTYTCHSNYVLQVDSQNTQTCSSDGTFSGASPVCLHVCPSSGLPTVAHSGHNGDGSYMDGDVVTYTCNSNYVLQVGSQNKQTCSSVGTFSGASPVCLHVCLSSGLPTVAYSSHNGDGSYMDGDVVTYTCHSNYVLHVGSENTQTCSSDGTFSGALPVCHHVCPSSSLPTVAHSGHNGDGSYMDGDVVTYTCDSNYVLQVGSQNTLTCSSGGTFSGASPVCHHVCPSSGLPTVAHSGHNGDGSYMDGDVVTYTCNSNYVLHVGSENTQTCSSDGTFSGASPVCLHVCLSSGLPTVAYSSHNGDGSYMDGDVVTYTCYSNYVLHVGSENMQTCSSDGTFSGASPVCHHVCPSSSLLTVAHSGHNGGGSYMDGDVVTYTCDSNYVLQVGSQNTLTCSSGGTFSGASPVCLHVCPSSGLPTVAHSGHNGDGSYMDGDVVTYTCHSNYVLQVGSENTQACSSVGTFSGASPVCLHVCPSSGLPTVAHSGHNGDGSYMDGDVVTYTCNSNYVLQVGSQNKQTCSSGGTFSGASPVCLHVCLSSGLPTVAYSSHNGDGSYMDGDVVTYTCLGSYILQDAALSTQTCSSDGMFSGASPVCLLCEASALPTVLDSVHDGDGTYQEGDVVTFTCNHGYLLGPGAPSAITCLDDGTFSGTPACVLNLNTVCYPNGTIVVGNPDTDLYVSAHASDTDDVCTTAWVAKGTVAKGLLEIIGCDKDSVITVFFSSRMDDTDEILGGPDVYAHVIKCDEIDADGVSYTFTQGLSPELSTASEAAVVPTVAFLSAFRTLSPVGEVQTTATVGEELYWTIDVPDEYTGIPLSCTAYAGTSASGTPSELVLQYGCTEDVYLLESFSDDKIQGDLPDVRRYYTRMWTFKFQSNNHVFFHCNMRLCPAGSPHCNIDCDKRKKRSAELGEGEMVGTTSRVLLVNPADEFISSSTKSRLQQDLAVACAVTLVCWFIKAMFL